MSCLLKQVVSLSVYFFKWIHFSNELEETEENVQNEEAKAWHNRTLLEAIMVSFKEQQQETVAFPNKPRTIIVRSNENLVHSSRSTVARGPSH